MSYGIGAELLRKMGYVDGEGLGRDGTGITKPIEVNFAPKGMGIGAMTAAKSIEEDYYYSSEDDTNENEQGTSEARILSDKEKVNDNELEKGMLKLDVSTKDENDAPKMREELVQYGILQFSDKILNAIDRTEEKKLKKGPIITNNEIAFIKARKTLQGKKINLDDERTILIEFIKLYKRFIFKQQQLSEEKTSKINLENTSTLLGVFEDDFSQIEAQILELNNFESMSEFSYKIENLLKIIGRCIGFINNEFRFFEIDDDLINHKIELLLTSILYEGISKLIQWIWTPSAESSNDLNNAFDILADEIFAWGEEIVPTLSKYSQNNNAEESISLNLFDSIVTECLLPKVRIFFENEWQEKNVNSLTSLHIIHTSRKILNVNIFNYLLFSVIIPKLTNYFEELSHSLLVVQSNTEYVKGIHGSNKMNNFLNWADLLSDDAFLRNEFIDKLTPLYEKYFVNDFIEELNQVKLEKRGELCILGFNEIFLNGRSDNEKLMVMKMLNNTLIKKIVVNVVENENELDGESFLWMVYGFKDLYSSMKHREKLYEVLLNEVFIKYIMAHQYIKLLQNSFVDTVSRGSRSAPHVSMANWLQQRFTEIRNFTRKAMGDPLSEVWISTEKILIHFLDTLNNCIDMYEVKSEQAEFEQYIQSVRWDFDIRDVIDGLNHSLVQ